MLNVVGLDLSSLEYHAGTHPLCPPSVDAIRKYKCREMEEVIGDNTWFVHLPSFYIFKLQSYFPVSHEELGNFS